MSDEIFTRFMKISELYLRMTEQKRSAENIEELCSLVFINDCDELIPAEYQYKSCSIENGL